MSVEKLPNCELDVMEILWEEGKLSQSAIKASLEKRKNRVYGRTTVATWLGRLKKKGFLEIYYEDDIAYYRATVKQEQYEQMEVTLLTSRLFKGFFPRVVSTFIDAKQMTEDDVNAIREMLDDWKH